MKHDLIGWIHRQTSASHNSLTIGTKSCFTVLSLSLIILAGCSYHKLVVATTSRVIERGLPALYKESDLIVAETALISNLKLLEVLLENDPLNESINLMLAQGYYAYALGFVEDKDPERASYFYAKGRDYALNLLNTNASFRNNLHRSGTEFLFALQKMDQDWVEPLFWCAANWGNWIMVNLNNPEALFKLPQVEAMMSRVLELDETFFFAGAHLFFGSLNAARPVILGGNPDLAQKHFQKALRITNNKCLLVHYYYARFYAPQVGNKILYERLLTEIDDAPQSILPEFNLITQIAKEKAKIWRAENTLLFEEENE